MGRGLDYRLDEPEVPTENPATTLVFTVRSVWFHCLSDGTHNVIYVQASYFLMSLITSINNHMTNFEAENFWYIFNQAKRLLALSCRQFEAIRHKFHCKHPFK